MQLDELCLWGMTKAWAEMVTVVLSLCVVCVGAPQQDEEFCCILGKRKLFIWLCHCCRSSQMEDAKMKYGVDQRPHLWPCPELGETHSCPGQWWMVVQIWTGPSSLWALMESQSQRA